MATISPKQETLWDWPRLCVSIVALVLLVLSVRAFGESTEELAPTDVSTTFSP